MNRTVGPEATWHYGGHAAAKNEDWETRASKPACIPCLLSVLSPDSEHTAAAGGLWWPRQIELCIRKKRNRDQSKQKALNQTAGSEQMAVRESA